MTCLLYVFFLGLHPPAFRREFGREMLWIFDEGRVSEGAFVLLLDLLISMARQWLLRSGAWKLALALIGATAQVLLGGGAWWLVNSSRNRGAPGPQLSPAMSDVLLVALCTVGMLVVMVSVATCWVGQLNRRRVAGVRRGA
jgi:hypothetical protein